MALSSDLVPGRASDRLERHLPQRSGRADCRAPDDCSRACVSPRVDLEMRQFSLTARPSRPHVPRRRGDRFRWPAGNARYVLPNGARRMGPPDIPAPVAYTALRPRPTIGGTHGAPPYSYCRHGLRHGWARFAGAIKRGKPTAAQVSVGNSLRRDRVNCTFPTVCHLPLPFGGFVMSKWPPPHAVTLVDYSRIATARC